jgi:hypothetical protein
MNSVTQIKHFIESKIGVRGRREKRRKQVLDDLQEKRRRCVFKVDSLDFTVYKLTMEQAVNQSQRVLRI